MSPQELAAQVQAVTMEKNVILQALYREQQARNQLEVALFESNKTIAERDARIAELDAQLAVKTTRSARATAHA